MNSESFLPGSFCFSVRLLSYCLLIGSLALPSQAEPPPNLQFSSEELSARLEKAGDDPLQLLVLVPHAEKDQAKQIRLQIQKLLVQKYQVLTSMELNQLGKKFAQELSQNLLTAEHVTELLGPQKKVSRQLLFRKYLEQWRYDQPLPLLITFTHHKGLPPKVTKVQAWKPGNP